MHRQHSGARPRNRQRADHWGGPTFAQVCRSCAGSTAEPVPETDSVLTTGEVYELLEAHGTRLQDTPRAALDCLPGTPPLTPPGAWPGGSGKCISPSLTL